MDVKLLPRMLPSVPSTHDYFKMTNDIPKRRDALHSYRLILSSTTPALLEAGSNGIDYVTAY